MSSIGTSGSSEVNDVNCEMLTNLDLMDIDVSAHIYIGRIGKMVKENLKEDQYICLRIHGTNIATDTNVRVYYLECVPSETLYFSV